MIIYSFIVSFIYGIIPIIIKLHLSHIPHTLLLLFIQIIGIFIISSYIFFFKPQEFNFTKININFNIIFFIILTAFFGTFLANKLYIKIINESNNFNINMIITSLYPIITIIASYFILKEYLNQYQLFGYLFIIIGISIIFYFKH